MYFVEKKGVYSHGVFWIGDDIENGKGECDKLSAIDCDCYHEYVLYEFGILNKSKMPNGEGKSHHHYQHEPEHSEIYRTRQN